MGHMRHNPMLRACCRDDGAAWLRDHQKKNKLGVGDGGRTCRSKAG